MRLIGNKEYISYDNITDRIYLKEKNTRNSDINIWNRQAIWIRGLITSNDLIHNIRNDINRE
jgi:hypothetical protein